MTRSLAARSPARVMIVHPSRGPSAIQPCPLAYARADESFVRLLKALLAAGANSNTLMANAWVHDIALKDASVQGTKLSSALAYAKGQGWIADGPREGWTIITRAGERAARLRVVGL